MPPRDTAALRPTYVAGPSACPAHATSETFAGASAPLRAMLREVERLARFEHTTVLLEGESGTGKSYVARHLHQCSPRARPPFQQVILSALDDSLAASDLFGHLRGSYTDARQSRPGHFVSANTGTLFLDEIGKASHAVQRKLLHAIEHHEIWPVGADRAIRLDVRLVLATNVPLETLVDSGAFLDDLAARLLTFRVRLPSLRERRDDIPALVRQFLTSRAASCGHPAGPPMVHADLMAALERADWPHNLRQLVGTVQRLLINSEGEEVMGVEHCTGEVARLLDPYPKKKTMPSHGAVAEAMAELDSVTAVAQRFEISRHTVYRYLGKEADE